MKHWALIVVLLSATSCGRDKLPDPPDFEPTLVSSDELVLWQGFDHSWTYNHRWGRLGSGFVRFDTDLAEDSYPVEEEPVTELPTEEGWYYMGTAGAGTGKDLGTHQVFGARITEAASVGLGSFTTHRRVQGDEGQVVSDSWKVTVELPEGGSAESVEALLNGFWVRSVGDEAKQPFRFSLDVGEPVVDGDSVTVALSVELGLECDTPECKGCTAKIGSKRSDDFVYDMYVDVAVIAGPSASFASERATGTELAGEWRGPRHDAEGDGEACLKPRKKDDCYEYWVECGDLTLGLYPELDAEAGREPFTYDSLPSTAAGTIGLTGFEFTLDEPHHMLAFEVGVRDVVWDTTQVTGTEVFRFQNWQHEMNILGQDWDPLSATAFGTNGEFTGRVRVAQLAFAGATVEPVEVEATMLTEVTQQVIAEP